MKILNRVKSRTFNENGNKGKLYRSYDFFGDETRIEACGMMMKVFLKHRLNSLTLYIKKIYGYNPLLESVHRLEPVLFQENVSITRKKYPQLETIQP